MCKKPFASISPSAMENGDGTRWPAADLIDDKSLPTNSKPSRAPKLAPLDVFPDGPRDRSDNRQEEEVPESAEPPVGIEHVTRFVVHLRTLLVDYSILKGF